MSELKPCNVLITAAGNVFMPGTMSCIKQNGEREIRLIGADMSRDETILQMCDGAHQVPRGDDPAYVDALLEICVKEKIDILLPIMSVELQALSENRGRFAAVGTKVSVSDPGPLRIANNKRNLLDFMREQGLNCAAYYTVRNAAELKEKAEALGYPEKPVCVKTAGGSGSRGFRILDARTSRPGAEYSVDLLADRGETLVGCCRRSLRMENSIMLDAELVDAPEVLSVCAEITRLLGLDGNIGFDLRERADGTPVVMECNPRITAGIPYFALAGVNLPYLCIKKLLGEQIPDIQLCCGTVVKRRWMEMAI